MHRISLQVLTALLTLTTLQDCLQLCACHAVFNKVADQILFTFDLQYAHFFYECLDVYTLHTSRHVSSRSTHHQELCNFWYVHC
jgi:hypothetical protein